MEIYLDYKDDLVLQANGDFLLVDGSEKTKQRIIRRLLTNPGSYIWHPDYGAGLGQYIGKLLSPSEFAEIQGVCVAQILKEEAVAKTPAPKVQLWQNPTDYTYSTLICRIDYTDAISQQPFVLSFQVSQ